MVIYLFVANCLWLTVMILIIFWTVWFYLSWILSNSYSISILTDLEDCESFSSFLLFVKIYIKRRLEGLYVALEDDFEGWARASYRSQNFCTYFHDSLLQSVTCKVIAISLFKLRIKGALLQSRELYSYINYY